MKFLILILVFLCRTPISAQTADSILLVLNEANLIVGQTLPPAGSIKNPYYLGETDPDL